MIIETGYFEVGYGRKLLSKNVQPPGRNWLQNMFFELVAKLAPSAFLSSNPERCMQATTAHEYIFLRWHFALRLSKCGCFVIDGSGEAGVGVSHSHFRIVQLRVKLFLVQISATAPNRSQSCKSVVFLTLETLSLVGICIVVYPST